MTDELQDVLPPQQKLDMWTRCPACSTVMPNIAIAKQGHKLNCPHDLQLKVQKLEDRIRILEGQLSGVSGHVETLSAEPSVDLAGIAPWEDEPSEEHVTVQTSSIPIIPNPIVRQYLDEDDEEDDLR